MPVGPPSPEAPLSPEMKAPRSFVPDYVRWVGMANRVAPTIIGGPAVTAAPEPLFRRTGATYALAGQGEASFPVFLEELQAKATSFEAAGLIWREGDAIRCNPMDLSGHDRGIDWSFIDLAKYKRPYMAHGLVTKSGCAHQCAFCDAHWTSPRVPRPRPGGDRRRHPSRRPGLQAPPQRVHADRRLLQPAGRLGQGALRGDHPVEARLGFAAVIEPTADLDGELCRLMVRAGCTMHWTEIWQKTLKMYIS